MLPAHRGIVVLILSLVMAAFLQADGLRKEATIQAAGVQRNVALAVTQPLDAVSRALHLTTPRHDLQVAIGRGGEDDIDTRVAFAPPPPKEAPKPRVAEGSGPPPKPLFTSSHPLRVWVGGDSLAEVPGQALQRLGGAIDVVGVESRLSTGLARPDLYNWFARIEQVPRLFHPDVVVLSFGADDAHDYLAGLPAGVEVGQLGSPSWDAEYERRVNGITAELNAKGIYVVWLGLPDTDHHGLRASFPIVNRIIRQVVAKHRALATFVNTWTLLGDAHGRYASYLRVHGTLTQVRLADGTHYAPAGGDLIARQVVAQLRAVYRLRGAS